MFGGAMEIAQGVFTRNRYPDILDSFANLCGSLVVTLSFYLFIKMKSKSTTGLISSVVFLFAGALIPLSEGCCADNIFNSGSELQASISRLSYEAAEVATTPFDLQDKAIFTTIAVGGVVVITSFFDEDIRNEFSGHGNRNSDRIAEAASVAGDPFLHLALSASVYGGGVLADSTRYKNLGEMFGEAVILADASTLILKQSIGRGRPSVTSSSSEYKPFKFQGDYDSMPSMHTASSFAMASVMASQAESIYISVSSYLAASFVGLSRIYQEKHWASDVLLGAAIGELCGRTVTRYHATANLNRFSVVPAITDTTALVSIVRRF